MKMCPNCGKELNDEDVFCKACGTRIENAESAAPPEQQTVINDMEQQKNTKNKGCMIAIIIAVMLVIICLFAMCSASNSSEKTEENKSTPIPALQTAAPVVTTPPTSVPAPTPEAAPVTKEFVRENYGYVDYKELARNPDNYKGKSISYSGKVVQVMEGDTEVHHRIAVNGSYDSVIYVAYHKDMVASRILEDDYVTVYGTSMGLYSYQSTGSGQITIPSIYLDRIELQSN